jgi:chromosome segregation ATPase
MEREARQILADFTKAKKLAGDKKALADEKAPITDENGEPTQLKMQLEEIGLDNLNELDCAYEEAMAKANDIADNPDAIRQYEQRKKDIDQLEIELERRTNHEANKVKRIDELGNAWERALMKHVSEVNKLFTTYMSEMGCTGEISVCKGKAQDEAADPRRNYKDWGIQILVSFRGQAKAQALSAERNSGGERSVCTIMYLMALQEMMVAPFRCVDEINQGLDERNERLVFRRIVANSCRAPDEDDASDHSGQYFLITPKLLPNLTDMEHEAVTLLFVMNGKYYHGDG